MSDNLAPQSSRLLGLPSEVRLLIYEKMFPPCTLDLYACDDTLLRGMDSRLVASDFLNLLATCRTVHDEATPVLHANTEFHVNFAFGVLESLPEIILRVYAGRYDDWTNDPKQKMSLALVRKMSITVLLSNKHHWSREGLGPDNTWLEYLPSQLRKAPNLKQLHITLETKCGGTNGLNSSLSSQDIKDDALIVIDALSKVEWRGKVTAAMEMSLIGPHFERSSYYCLLAKANWVDTTQEIILQKLSSLTYLRRQVMEYLQCGTAQLVKLSAEKKDLVVSEEYYLSSEARVDSVDQQICGFASQTASLKGELKELVAMTTGVEACIKMLAEEPLAHAGAAPSATN